MIRRIPLWPIPTFLDARTVTYYSVMSFVHLYAYTVPTSPVGKVLTCKLGNRRPSPHDFGLC